MCAQVHFETVFFLYQLDVCYHFDGKKLVVILFCYQLDICYHLFARVLKFIVELHLLTSASSSGPRKIHRAVCDFGTGNEELSFVFAR